MTTKERALQLIQALPEDATLDNIMEELQHLEQVRMAGMEEGPERPAPEGGAWDLLRSLTGALEMPPDWASEHDHYLYGTPKRSPTV